MSENENKTTSKQLPHVFDTWFDIKDHEDLRREIDRLENEVKRLRYLKELCKEYGIKITKKGRNKK